MSSQTNITSEQDRHLETLRGIEALGGSAGYQMHIESAANTNANANQPDRSKFPTQWTAIPMPVVGNTWTALVYTSVTISAPVAGHSGRGHAWGPGVGAMAFEGLLSYNSWDTLKSAPNDFFIVGDDEAVGGVIIYLSINGEPVGVVAAASEGADALIGVDGSLTWT